MKNVLFLHAPRGPEEYHHNLSGLLVCGPRFETTIPKQSRSAIDRIATLLTYSMEQSPS